MSISYATPVFNELVAHLEQCTGCLGNGWPRNLFSCCVNDVLCPDSDRTCETL